MKQQIELVKQDKKFLKPSEILRGAHLKGIQKCEGSYKQDNAYCARGVILKEFGESKGYKINPYGDYITFMDDSVDTCNLEYELFSMYLYNRKPDDLTVNEFEKIHSIQWKLARFNDSSSDITFLDCARELEKIGL